MDAHDVYAATTALLREMPDLRGTIRAIVDWVKATPDKAFCRGWIVTGAREYGSVPPANLRPLVARGILQPDGEASQGGHIAYYTMPDVDAVERAVNDTR